jgi:UDP-N-acetylmuramoylalanine--D-glutamate ligase
MVVANRASYTTGNAAMTASGDCTLVVGLGVTGLAVARHLTARGDRVRVLDTRNMPPELPALESEMPQVQVELGEIDMRWLDDAGCVVLSPGLATDIPLVKAARERGIPVLGELELFAREAVKPVVAITGSNGKSTVTTLTARLLRAAGVEAPAGGNLGPPALDLLRLRPVDAYVLEVSSFQMETTESLHPVAAALLNIAADHLDRHGSLEHYAALKARLIAAADVAVVNVDDVIVREAAQGHPHAIAFSVAAPLQHGYSVQDVDGRRWLARDAQPLLACDTLKMRGTHNEANALAALALADALCRAMDLGPASDNPAVLNALAAFAGLPHRCQWVAEIGGVTFINDSKGTNVAASLAALEGLRPPVVLIAGGLAKGADLAPLATAARGRVRAAVLIGAAAPQLRELLAPVCEVHDAPDMNDAVATAHRIAQPGDTVLLSPACASQDMFVDYRHRGDAFTAAVRELTR